MRKAVDHGRSWFETDHANVWELPEGQTLWRTETGAWVLETKQNLMRSYAINVVSEGAALACFTEHGIEIPREFLDDGNRI